jgi:hypothetical protein
VKEPKIRIQKKFENKEMMGKNNFNKEIFISRRAEYQKEDGVRIDREENENSGFTI